MIMPTSHEGRTWTSLWRSAPEAVPVRCGQLDDLTVGRKRRLCQDGHAESSLTVHTRSDHTARRVAPS
jgi:hypothetical protein